MLLKPLVEALEPRQLLSTVAVSVNTTFQTIKAMGANFAKTARNPGAPVSDPIMKYLLTNLNPEHARIPINLYGWEPKPDNNDPNVINWAGFKDTGRQHEQFLQLQELKDKYGINFFTASIFTAPDWLVVDTTKIKNRKIKPELYRHFAEGIGAFLIRARDTYGVRIETLSINESNAGFNVQMPISVFTAFVKVAGPMFEKMGLGYVKWLVADDGLVGTGNYFKPAMQDASIRPYIGALGWHTWNLDQFPDNLFSDMGKVANQFGQEYWATETGYDPLMDSDKSKFTTWDNAREYAKIYLRTLKLMPTTVMDYWQFADDFPLVSPLLKPYPTFYIIKTYEDNLKPGSKIVKAASDHSSVLSLAAKDQANNHFWTQAINTATANKDVTFTGLPNLPLVLTRSSATENSAVIGTFTPVGGKLTITLPADSVTNLAGKLFSGASGAPAPQISAPGSSTLYTAGGKISFSGSASDPQDGNLAASALTWTVQFHHNGQVDPAVTYKGVTGGSFTAPATNQRQTDQFYRITLKAIDNDGLEGTTTIDVKPRIANITMASNVPGLFTRIDGLAETTNTTIPMVAGSHKLDASSIVVLNGRQYAFISWSDGGARGHSVTNSGAVTYTANYVDITSTSSAGVVATPTADAYVNDGVNADMNFGTTTDLQVKNSADIGKTRISYLTFDISAITKTIGTVYLRMFGNYSGQDLVDTGVFGVSDTGWSETAITFNNRPATDAAAIANAKLGDEKSRWYQWDLTKYVAAAKAAGKSKVSFAIAQAIGGSTDTFNSREAASNTPHLLMTAASGTQPPPPPPASVTTTLDTISDAFVKDGTSVDTNFGSSTDLMVKVHASPGFTRRVYVQFDLSALTTISSAKLRLNGRLSSAEATNLTANIHDVTSQTWSESGITWNNRPGFAGSAIGSVTVANMTAKNYEVDLTSYLKAKKSVGATKVTLMFSAAVSAGPVILFASRETGNGPQLVVRS